MLLDFLIVGVAAALVILASRFGLEAGHPATRGLGAILGGFYLAYLGVLFLLSFFFSSACHVFGFLSHLCITCSRPASRHMALFYFALSVGIGSYLLLIGFGVL
ncbi:MAG: hypothetical protein ABUU24_02520 [Variovorax sp.]